MLLHLCGYFSLITMIMSLPQVKKIELGTCLLKTSMMLHFSKHHSENEVHYSSNDDIVNNLKMLTGDGLC